MAGGNNIQLKLRTVPAPAIPDKLYFRIAEVSKLCGVEPSVLRFWENAFPQLHPKRVESGQRWYRKGDVETALLIKSLLYDQGFTMAGAGRQLKLRDHVEVKELVEALTISQETIALAETFNPLGEAMCKHGPVRSYLQQLKERLEAAS